MSAPELFTPDQMAHLRRRSNLKGVWLVVHAWGMIFGAMALFVWLPHPITFVLAVMTIGARQLGLAILMHDGAHHSLCTNRKLNLFLSQWLCAYPMMAETLAYRRYHLKHHRYTQQAEDPDLILSAPFPITRKSFRRKMIRDLTGQTGFQQRTAQVLAALGPKDWPLARRVQHFGTKLGKPLVTQGVLFGGLAATGHWYLYPALWLVPFLTWHMAVTRVRNIAEHAMVPDNDDAFRNARTTLAGSLARLFLAPYWVNYHVEHHLAMWVPCYHLPQARAFLIANGFGERIETQNSYGQVLALATSKPDADDEPGSLAHRSRRRVAGTFSEGFGVSGLKADRDRSDAARPRG